MQSRTHDMVRNIINSAIAACVAEFITLPICTVKTNFQNTSAACITDVVEKIYTRNGAGGFYRSCLPATVAQMISTSTKYSFYRWLCARNEFPSMLNGMLGGIMSSVITHPFDVLKFHHQMMTPLLPIIRTQGIFVLYSGYSKSFLKVCAGSSIFFPLYYRIRQNFPNAAIASCITAIISTTIIQPIDFLKTRQGYRKSVWLGWNPRMYYRGLSLNLARVVPHYMITMTLIEYFT